MHRVVSNFVPRLLTQDQRDSRAAICQELLDHASNDENFLKRIITGDETWVYGYDVEMKMQSSQRIEKNLPRPKKARHVRSHESHVDGFFTSRVLFLMSGANSESLVLSQSSETSKRKCQEKKTSVAEKQHPVPPS
jgi:hypothetical protein